MELRPLRYFLAIAEEENITHAASILHVTQPTLTRQIQNLEDELGTKLFKRGKYSMKLTEDGMYLKRRAEEIISLADSTAMNIGTKDKEITGEISIGCTETDSMEELASAMSEFRTLHPAVSYRMITANVDTIREEIEKGLVDIALMTEPADTERFETLHLKTKEHMGAIVSSTSPLAGKSAVTPQDLQNEALIIPMRSEVRLTLENWLGCSFDKVNIAARYNLGRNVALLVRTGVGTAIGLNLFSDFDGLSFIPFSPPLVTGSVLCWKKNAISSPAVGSFLQFLSEPDNPAVRKN